MKMMRWGLTPSFTKPEGDSSPWNMFNARAETVGTSPVFRRLVHRRRCIVAMDGFFEWKHEGKIKGKVPYFVFYNVKDDTDVDTSAVGAAADGADGGDDSASDSKNEADTRAPMLMAAVYDMWHNVDGETLFSYAILTTDSSSILSWLHDRMPVLLSKEGAAAWLDTDRTLEDLAKDPKTNKMFVPSTNAAIKWHAVDNKKMQRQYNEADVSNPVKPPKTLTSFFSKKKSTAATTKKEPTSTPPSPSPSPAAAPPVTATTKEEAKTDMVAPAAAAAAVVDLSRAPASKRGRSDDDDDDVEVVEGGGTSGAGAGAGAGASPPASPDVDQTDSRPPCPYGLNCFKKRPSHFETTSHPQTHPRYVAARKRVRVRKSS